MLRGAVTKSAWIEHFFSAISQVLVKSIKESYSRGKTWWFFLLQMITIRLSLTAKYTLFYAFYKLYDDNMVHMTRENSIASDVQLILVLNDTTFVQASSCNMASNLKKKFPLLFGGKILSWPRCPVIVLISSALASYQW